MLILFNIIQSANRIDISYVVSRLYFYSRWGKVYLFLISSFIVTIVKALLHVNFLFNEEVGKSLHLITCYMAYFSKIEVYFLPHFCLVKLRTGNFRSCK